MLHYIQKWKVHIFVKNSSQISKFARTENVLCDVVNFFVGSENLLKVHLILSLSLSPSKELLVSSMYSFCKVLCKRNLSPDYDAWPAWWLAWVRTMCCNRESTEWRPWPLRCRRCRRGPTWPLLHQVSSGQGGGAGGRQERSNPHCNNTSTAVKI